MAPRPPARATKATKPRAPQDLTDYSLRGIRRDLAALDARITALEAERETPAPDPSPEDAPA